MTTERKTLWQIARDAYEACIVDPGMPPSEEDQWNAAMQAIADAVVPEEESPWSEWHPVDPGEMAGYKERQRIRALLFAEAAKAERAEGR